MKTAIVHDWLVGGGAERVVEELHHMYPDAPIYTSYTTDEWREKLNGKVVTGLLQRWPFSKLRKFIPLLRIWWFSRLNLKDYDLIISSTGAEAKGVKIRENQKHISYMHAPTHYYWDRYEEYLKSPGLPMGFNWLGRFGLRLLVGPLRKWDFAAAQRPNAIIANSSYTQTKIKQYYNRDSIVIHPPVDIERFAGIAGKERSGFVIAGRQTPYKRIDLAVAACTELGLALTVIGSGPQHGKLVDVAGDTVTFVTDASDQDIANHMALAQAFIFPGVDDFGIVAVEALAAGTPVIAYKAGGALDYVMEGKTGMFFEDQTVDSLVKALQAFKAQDYHSDDIKTVAQSFSKEIFIKNMHEGIDRVLQ